MALDILPDCRAKVQKNIVRLGQTNWTPIYCASCGADGGIVPSDNHDFAFYLCMKCSESYGQIDGVYMEPDAVFWERVVQEQLAEYGRLLTPEEQCDILKGDNTLSRLAKDKPKFGN